MYLSLTADSKAVTEDEFIRSAVIPLPERPPTDLVELIAILKPYQYANLRPYEYRRCSLATTQVALWLGRLGISDLQALRNSIPSLWSVGRGSEAHQFALVDILDDLIGEKQADSGVTDQPFAALGGGYRSAKADWKSAIASSSNIGDLEIRSKFLYGVALSAARAESLRAAEEIRSAIGELPSSYDRQKLSNYGHYWDQWVSLWPAESISAEANALPNRKKLVEAVFENEAHFFASPERQARFFESLGSHGSRIFSPSVQAARDPNGFLDWWEQQEDDLKNSTIEKAIVPLLRRDLILIERVIRSLSDKSDHTNAKVFEAWSERDPVGALDWAINRPFLQKRNIDFILLRSAETNPERAIDLFNRHPEISKIGFRYGTFGGLVADCFDPLRDRPDNFASAILTLTDPEIRKTALRSFGAKWGYHDGRAAFAFGEKIVEDSDREQWLVAILENWIEKAPDEAAAALNETIEVSGMDRERFTKQLNERRKRGPIPPIQSPSRFLPRENARVLVPAAGGETDPHRVSKLRKELAELAHPVGPHVANADLCLKIISLGNDTAIALFADLELNRPVNAKENALRKLLLERWALADPEGAARWIVEHGSGMDRESIPLALSRLALTDPELAFEFARFLPEDGFVARFAIVNAVATRSHRDACEIGKAHDCQIHEVYQDWRRIDPEAANEWLKARWMDRY